MKLVTMRCKKCRRLLFKGDVKTVEIKCPKCGYLQILQGDAPIKAVDIVHKKK